MAKRQKNNGQADKARIGAIGESLVLTELMRQGWDAFNANCTIKNYKSIDIVCINTDLKVSDELWWKPQTAFVQVKTSVQTYIPVGFSIEESLDKDYLEKMVKGPYIFVSAKPKEMGYTFRYFILSRRQFIDLLHSSHVFYDKWRNGQEVKTAPAGLSVSWLEGKPKFSPKIQIDFGNPIKKTCENQWQNIWIE